MGKQTDGKLKPHFDFAMAVPRVEGKEKTADPGGYRADDASIGSGIKPRQADNTALMEKKAWEASLAPAQSIGMNIFMLWMSGSSGNIFSILMLGYALSAVFNQFANVNQHFAVYATTIDCSLQKLAYLGLCCLSAGYMAWHMSGMGLLPTMTGDWIGSIQPAKVKERVL